MGISTTSGFRKFQSLVIVLSMMEKDMNTLIILDRDGVINYDSDEYIKTVDEWQPIPGSIEAIAKLSQAGYVIGVATNQSGIARGYFTLDTLNAMHAKMNQLVEQAGGKIHALSFCPHGPDEDCLCRKPKIALLQDISKQVNIPLAQAYFIGDTEKDVQTACTAGATPILVKTGKGERTLFKHPELHSQIAIFADLAEFTHDLLQGSQL